mgnify:CR=1 FL=1
MKKNSIADALRALTVAPSLESETAAESSIVTGDGDQTQTVEVKPVDETPADGEGAPGEDQAVKAVIVEEDKGPEGVESAETTSTDSPVTVAAVAGTVSAESADGESSAVTGDGDQTTQVQLEDAQTDQQEVEGEDKPGTAKTVEVDNGPKEEAATTESKDSEVITTGDLEVSAESLTLAALGFALAAGVVTAVVGNKAERAFAEKKKLEELLEKKKAALKASQLGLNKQIADGLEKAKKEKPEAVKDTDITGFGAFAGISYTMWFSYVFPYIGTLVSLGIFSLRFVDEARQVKKLADEIEDIEAKITERQIEILRDTAGTVSNEALDDAIAAADAAAAFAAGAAGAAEAAAAATEGGEAAAVAEPEVVADAAVEVEAAAAAEDTAEVAAAVAEEQAEAAEGAAEEVGDEVAETEDEEAAIAGGDEEMAELEDSIQAGEEHVEKYENAEATLESLANAIESAQSTGGMTQQSASFFNVGFESVGVFLTGKPFVNARGESPIPSLESYGVTDRRDRSTNVSMESVQEWLKKVWEVLKKTFAQIKEWLVKFFQAVFSQAERYKQRAAKYKAAASKVNSSSQGKSKTINLSAGLAGKLHIGGEVSRWDMHDLAELAKVAGARNAEGSRALIQLRQDFRSIITEGLKGEGADLGEYIRAKFSTHEINFEGELRNAAFSEAYQGESQQGYKTKVLPGGVELAIVSPKSESESAFQQFLAILKGWRVIEIKQDAEVKTEVQTPTGQQIAKICGDVHSTLETVTKAKAEFKAEALDLVDFQSSGEITEAQAKQVRGVTSAYAKAVQAQTSGTSKLFKYIISTCGAYLDLAAVALKEHGVNVTIAGQAGEAVAKAGQAVKDAAA